MSFNEILSVFLTEVDTSALYMIVFKYIISDQVIGGGGEDNH